jgi:hypothetical protein
MMDWDELFSQLGMPGRVFGVYAFGDDAGELELAALEEAEHAFGPGVPLAVAPCYRMSWCSLEEMEMTGKRYSAHIEVLARTAAPVPGPGEKG